MRPQSSSAQILFCMQRCRIWPMSFSQRAITVSIASLVQMIS